MEKESFLFSNNNFKKEEENPEPLKPRKVNLLVDTFK